MEIKDLKPGDLLLWKIYLRKNGFRKIISKLIGFFQPLINQGGKLKKTYSHIAIVDYDTTMMLESTFPRARKHPIEIPDMPYEMEVYRVKRANEVVTDMGLRACDVAIGWCYDHLDTRYDIWQLLSMGLFDAHNKEVCSTFIGVAYRHAGIILSVKGAEDKLISPNEIVSNKKEVEYIGKLVKGE